MWPATGGSTRRWWPRWPKRLQERTLPADNSRDGEEPFAAPAATLEARLNLTILIVEENPAARESWVEGLRSAGHRVFSFAAARSALDSLGATPVDAAFLSFKDPELCRELQAMLKQRNAACQVTLMTDRPAEDKDAQALESGAREVLLRPFAPERLGSLVERMSSSREKRTGRAITGGAATLLGESEPMAAVRRLIGQVAASPDTSVLVTGESGTGKELVARAVHAESQRSQQPFLEINCAAIPETLLESELFGHEAGAFTDATRARAGLFELADRGTLFLDEIGEMGLDLQAKLLRVLDTRSVRRVAGSELKKLDLRILAATNRDLDAEVKDRRFRGDLFHRLNVVHIHLPPLRERRSDVDLLARHFIGVFGRKFGRAVHQPDDLLLERLRRYDWPGNVRELANS
ncbi:MAG TPA: sigma-54 dependent transcriptional regulator, partial [Candidatus Eisenbacteria bacterium]